MTATVHAPHSLYGKTIRWSFNDGPTKGMIFEHTFNADGSVQWRMAGGKDAKPHRDAQSAAVRVSEDVHVVSYLSAESGYTLTVALDFNDGTVVGFASNGKEWSRQAGTFEML